MIETIINTTLGGIIGFMIFALELESDDMGGIIFRTDSSGRTVLSPESILEILKAPFKFKQFWTHISLLKVNWISMTLTGGFIGYIFDKMICK
jgi:hypothetical protein